MTLGQAIDQEKNLEIQNESVGFKNISELATYTLCSSAS